jgi:hypothetical protein
MGSVALLVIVSLLLLLLLLLLLHTIACQGVSIVRLDKDSNTSNW